MDNKNFDDFSDLLDVMDCLVATASALNSIAITLPKEQKEVVLMQATVINKTTEIMIQRLRRRVSEEKARING